MKDKDLLYHCIDWGLAVVLTFVEMLNKNYILVAVSISIASFVSIFLLVKKNKALKKDLDVYESLLKYPIPLYGLVNYIFKQKTISSTYKNVHIHLDELALNVKIEGEISATRNNDLKYSWTFVGKNNSRTDVGKFYLRIGGDSVSNFENLKVECVDCSRDMANCEFKNSLHKCLIKKECLRKESPYFTKINLHDSKTLYLLDINFIERIKANEDFRLKVSYIWPQCYNCNADFLLIDPNNFAESVGKIRITVTIDGIVIKSISKVQLFSMDNTNNKIENEGQVILSQNKKIFERLFNVKSNKIYFVTIENK